MSNPVPAEANQSLVSQVFGLFVNLRLGDVIENMKKHVGMETKAKIEAELKKEDLPLEYQQKLEAILRELEEEKDGFGDFMYQLYEQAVIHYKVTMAKAQTAQKKAEESAEASKKEIETLLSQIGLLSHDRIKVNRPDACKQCQICFVDYADHQNSTPRVLPCGHTMCQGCVMQTSGEFNHVKKCQFCGKEFFVNPNRDPNQLPKNYALLN